MIMRFFSPVSLADFLQKPVAVPNEVDNLVFHGKLRGKQGDLNSSSKRFYA
jgi:hypothetical protein